MGFFVGMLASCQARASARLALFYHLDGKQPAAVRSFSTPPGTVSSASLRLSALLRMRKPQRQSASSSLAASQQYFFSILVCLTGIDYGQSAARGFLYDVGQLFSRVLFH